LTASIAESVRLGFTGFRRAGERSWAAGSADHCKQVTGYEKMVEQCYPGKKAVGLCQYRMDAFPADVLQALLESHKLHVIEPPRASRYASLDICHHSHITEIVAPKSRGDANYYYVVQDTYPRNILGWGVARDFDSANAQAARLVPVTSASAPGTTFPS